MSKMAEFQAGRATRTSESFTDSLQQPARAWLATVGLEQKSLGKYQSRGVEEKASSNTPSTNRTAKH